MKAWLGYIQQIDLLLSLGVQFHYVHPMNHLQVAWRETMRLHLPAPCSMDMLPTSGTRKFSEVQCQLMEQVKSRNDSYDSSQDFVVRPKEMLSSITWNKARNGTKMSFLSCSYFQEWRQETEPHLSPFEIENGFNDIRHKYSKLQGIHFPSSKWIMESLELGNSIQQICMQLHLLGSNWILGIFRDSCVVLGISIMKNGNIVPDIITENGLWWFGTDLRA